MIVRDGIVLLQYSDLVNAACLSKPAYDKACREGRITVVRRGGHGSPALIDWVSLPERYKEMVCAHLGGDPAELAMAMVVERHLLTNAEDMRFLDEYRAPNGLGLTTEARQQLGLAARIVALLAEITYVANEGGGAKVRATYGMSTMQLKEAIVAYVRGNKANLPAKFPTTFSRLEARKRAYLSAKERGLPGASALIHGGHGNANASKLSTPEQQQLLRLLAARHQNHALTRIARDYNAVAVEKSWPTISADSVRNFLRLGSNGRAVKVYAQGMAAYHNTYGVVVHRSRPTQPTYLWVHDATDYELLYQKEVAGKRTYHHRKKVAVVLDPHSWYPVGYAIGEEDTIELTQRAVADAVRHMHELIGHYALPYQAQSDRLGWKTLGDWYAAMEVAYTPAAPRNARAKVIEPWFKQHNDTYVCSMPNWSGHNITARKQPNPDALNALRHSFPSEAGVVEQIHECIARERSAKMREFRSALQAMPAGQLRTIDRARFLELFGVRHPWTNELTNRGLCPTLLGAERTYQLLDRSFQEHIGTGFQLIYDPADLSNVLAVARDGALRFVVPEAQPIPMALMDHTPETRRRLADVQAFKLSMSQEAIDSILNDRASLDRLSEALLADAAHTIARRVHRPRADDVVLPTPEVEAVTKAYLTEGGSHKAALRTATPPPPRIDPERWAEDQL